MSSAVIVKRIPETQYLDDWETERDANTTRQNNVQESQLAFIHRVTSSLYDSRVFFSHTTVHPKGLVEKPKVSGQQTLN